MAVSAPAQYISWAQFLSGGSWSSSVAPAFNQSAGRIWNALMMYDSCRLMKCTVSIRPVTLPFNYTPGENGAVPIYGPLATHQLYLSWDRYGFPSAPLGNPASFSENIRDDPSCKWKAWGPGSEPTALWHKISAIPRDYHNFINLTLTVPSGGTPTVTVASSGDSTAYSPFYPTLLLGWNSTVNQGTDPVVLYVVIQMRVKMLFQGARTYSNPALP